MITPITTGFISPCQPTKVDRPPSGSNWAHEIKHDGYRLMLRRDGSRVRCFTKSGYDGPTASRPSLRPRCVSMPIHFTSTVKW